MRHAHEEATLVEWVRAGMSPVFVLTSVITSIIAALTDTLCSWGGGLLMGVRPASTDDDMGDDTERARLFLEGYGCRSHPLLPPEVLLPLLFSS